MEETTARVTREALFTSGKESPLKAPCRRYFLPHGFVGVVSSPWYLIPPRSACRTLPIDKLIKPIGSAKACGQWPVERSHTCKSIPGLSLPITSKSRTVFCHPRNSFQTATIDYVGTTCMSHLSRYLTTRKRTIGCFNYAES